MNFQFNVKIFGTCLGNVDNQTDLNKDTGDQAILSKFIKAVPASRHDGINEVRKFVDKAGENEMGAGKNNERIGIYPGMGSDIAHFAALADMDIYIGVDPEDNFDSIVKKIKENTNGEVNELPKDEMRYLMVNCNMKNIPGDPDCSKIRSCSFNENGKEKR